MSRVRQAFRVGQSAVAPVLRGTRVFLFHTRRLFIIALVIFNSVLLNIKLEKAGASCPNNDPAQCVHMLLFWDGGAAPSGWTDVSSTYNNLFPRGDTVANFGTTGGTSNHIPTVASVATSTPTNQLLTGGSSNIAPVAHTHPPASVTVTNNSPAAPPSSEGNNIPVYRTLQLIRYDGAGGSGIPNTIPAGGIAIFDDSPGIPPTGWTRVTAQDGKVIRIGTTAGSTGGSDTHNYTLTWSGLGATSTTPVSANGLLATQPIASAPNHTHAAPAPTTSATYTSLPPYVTPSLAKANAATPTISVGFSAMFDGDPGGGWVVRSDSSGGAENTTFYHQFVRPNTAWNSGASSGRDNETLANESAVTGPASAGVNSLNLGLGSGSQTVHTHTLTASFNNSTDVLPPYFGVVIAEKVNFIQHSYKWYQDSGANDVTNPWSSLMPNADTPIAAIPVAYNPPDLMDQLRLRVLINVNGNNLAAGVAQFKVQYKEGGTDNSCTDGTWTDVDTAGTGTAAWRYGTSAAPGHPVDGDNLTTTKLSADFPQQFVASSSSAYNHSAVSLGQTMEYDFYLQNNAAKGATHYYFRVSETVGTLLSQYDTCPELITKPQTAQQMRHGLFFIDGYKAAFSWAK